MYLSFNQVMRLPALQAVAPHLNVMVHHEGQFFNASVRDLQTTVLGDLPQRVSALEEEAVPSIWPSRRLLSIEGAVTGQGYWDGTEDLRIQVQFQDQGMSIHHVQGLTSRLTALRDLIDDKPNADGRVATADRWSQARSLTLTGDLVSEPVSMDGSEDTRIPVRLNDQIAARLNGGLRGLAPRTGLDGNAERANGVYYSQGPSQNLPQASGMLWHAASEGGKLLSQFFQGFNTGRLWTRSVWSDAAKTPWTEVWTSASFNPESKASINDALTLSTLVKDYHQKTPTMLGRWNSATFLQPTARGVFLQVNELGNNQDAIAGNTLNRLGFAAGGRLFHHQNVDGKHWTQRELWTTDNFNPTSKANAVRPQVVGPLTVHNERQAGKIVALQVGRDARQPRWRLEMDHDQSLNICAISEDQTQTQCLFKLTSRLMGVNSSLHLNANAMTIGVDRSMSVYRHSVDSWGTFSSGGAFGWQRADNQRVTWVDKNTARLTHTGIAEFRGSVSATRLFAGWDAGITGGISCDNWFHSSGRTGWMSTGYGGGIYMTDPIYVRTFNSKRLAAHGLGVYVDPVYRAQERPMEDAGPLKPITYIDLHEGETAYGFDVQSLREHYPDVVHDRGDYTTVDVMGILSIAVTQSNDQQQRITALEQEMSELRAMMRELLES